MWPFGPLDPSTRRACIRLGAFVFPSESKKWYLLSNEQTDTPNDRLDVLILTVNKHHYEIYLEVFYPEYLSPVRLPNPSESGNLTLSSVIFNSH